MPEPLSPCPHPDCDRTIPRQTFACSTHWFSLPKELRNRIWANFRSGNLQRILSGYEEAEHFWTTP
jgi:hypothetical protein